MFHHSSSQRYILVLKHAALLAGYISIQHAHTARIMVPSPAATLYTTGPDTTPSRVNLVTYPRAKPARREGHLKPILLHHHGKPSHGYPGRPSSTRGERPPKPGSYPKSHPRCLPLYRTPGTAPSTRGGPPLKPRVVAYVPPVEPQTTPVPQRCAPKMHGTATVAKPMVHFLQEEPAGAGTLYQAPPERQGRRAGSSSSPSCRNYVQPHETPPAKTPAWGLARPMPFAVLR
jgi:hypothetical protein